jgi:hypothetical protein
MKIFKSMCEIEKWFIDIGDVLELIFFCIGFRNDKKLLLEKNPVDPPNQSSEMEEVHHLYIRQSDLPIYKLFVDKSFKVLLATKK